MVEVIDTIIDLLKDNWTKANTNGRIPNISKSWENHNPSTRDNNDWILCYEAANTTDYPALAMKWKDEDWLISLDIRCGNREQTINIDAEIIRILDLMITTVTGYSWLEPRGRRDLIQDINKPYFRMVRDVLVRKLSIVT